MSLKDDIFKKDIFKGKPFKFNETVTEVFENTLERSIPGYEEVVRMSLELIDQFLPVVPADKKKSPPPDQVIIYDLGSSTGYFLKKLMIHLVLGKNFFNKNFQFVGVDASSSMVKEARKKCKNLIEQKLVKFIQKDLTQFEFPSPVNIVTLNYTLQFLPEAEKFRLLEQIYAALKPGGIVIVSEKIKVKEKKTNQLFVDCYYQFKKRNHYDEDEINRKKIALEPIIFLQTIEDLQKNFKKVGFQKFEMIYKWYNFASFLMMK